MPIKYKIDVIAALKEAGYNTTRIRKEKIMGEAMLQKIRSGQMVSWATLETICGLLNCQPGDLLEYTKEQEGAVMLGDTDLPLALIMEEILGWEKKPGQKDKEEEENQQKDSVSKKF